MVDVAMLTKRGGRDHNEDYIRKATYKDQLCLILCDGLGGHACGEVASELVAASVAEIFSKQGYYAGFFKDAFEQAQKDLLAEQERRDLRNSMKTTLVVLVITPELIQWAHIGDSRLYRVYENGTKYQRTRDHSLVQILCDTGEIKESEIREHEDRNKLLRAMGAVLDGQGRARGGGDRRQDRPALGQPPPRSRPRSIGWAIPFLPYSPRPSGS